MNIFRRAMAFLLFLTLLPAPTQAKILAGPYLQNPTSTSIMIRWISDGGGSVIQYGGDLNLFDVFTERRAGAPLLQKIPLFPSLGNHEYGEKPRSTSHLDEMESLQTYTALFNLSGNERYYSHDYGNVHFIHLNIARQWTSNAAAKPQWIL